MVISSYLGIVTGCKYEENVVISALRANMKRR